MIALTFTINLLLKDLQALLLWRQENVVKSDVDAINVWLNLAGFRGLTLFMAWIRREGRGKPKQMKLMKCRYFLLVLSAASRSQLSNLSGRRNVYVFLLFLNDNYVYK